MRGNIIWASAVLGLCLVLAGGVMVGGFWLALDNASRRFESAVRDHAKSVERGGAEAGLPIRNALRDMTVSLDRHAGSVERAGEIMSTPRIEMTGPVAVEQPVRIVGPREDGSLPVNATIGK